VPTAKPEPPKPPEPTPTPPPAPTSRPAAPTPSSPSVGILAPVAPTTTTPQPATPAAQATAPAASPTPTRAPDAASAAITPAGSPTVAQLTKAPEPSARSPRPSPAGTHVVEAGETLHAIARLRDVQVAQLLDLNPLENADRLRIGQVLRLPTTFRIYVVKPGDTLGEIAEAVGVDSSAVLMKANGLDDTLILPGQELKIPS
jgi:LysM repeat protein